MSRSTSSLSYVYFVIDLILSVWKKIEDTKGVIKSGKSVDN